MIPRIGIKLLRDTRSQTLWKHFPQMYLVEVHQSKSRYKQCNDSMGLSVTYPTSNVIFSGLWLYILLQKINRPCRQYTKKFMMKPDVDE